MTISLNNTEDRNTQLPKLQNINERDDDTAYQNTPIYVVLKVLNTKNLAHKLTGI